MTAPDRQRHDALERLRAAFPPSLATEVERAVLALPAPEHPCSEDDIGPVVLDGRALRIPWRVYFPRSPSRLGALDPVTACILTRHHDGHVREAAVRGLLEHDAPWIVPFVLQLVGEYVIEIVEVIEAKLARLLRPDALAFVREAPAFVRLTEQRAASYWNCYYRRRFPRRRDYPGTRVLRRIVEASAASTGVLGY